MKWWKLFIQDYANSKRIEATVPLSFRCINKSLYERSGIMIRVDYIREPLNFIDSRWFKNFDELTAWLLSMYHLGESYFIIKIEMEESS